MSTLSWNSFSALATFTAVTGAWDTNYPVGNLSDLRTPTKVAKVVPASGVAAFSFALDKSHPIGFLGLINHTMAAGAQVRFELFSDAAMSHLLSDSGVIAVWPSGGPVSGYPSVMPNLPAPTLAKYGLVTLSGLAGPISIGAMEIAKAWNVNIGVNKGFGFSTRATPRPLLGAGATPVSASAPRMMSGQIDLLALTEASKTGLDFQIGQGMGNPFVYVENYADPTTWARRNVLVRNSDLPPSVGALYRSDTFQFRFTEVLR